jgi:hypothetical protein
MRNTTEIALVAGPDEHAEPELECRGGGHQIVRGDERTRSVKLGEYVCSSLGGLRAEGHDRSAPHQLVDLPPASGRAHQRRIQLGRAGSASADTLPRRAHARDEERRQEQLEAEKARYAKECEAREAEIAERNAAVDKLAAELGYGVVEAVEEYVSIVMSQSVYSGPRREQSCVLPLCSSRIRAP